MQALRNLLRFPDNKNLHHYQTLHPRKALGFGRLVKNYPLCWGIALPNIIGNTSDSTKVLDLISVTGAITNRRADKPNFSSYGGGGGSYAFGFNASLSNGLYGKSSTVQTSALQTLIIIKT